MLTFRTIRFCLIGSFVIYLLLLEANKKKVLWTQKYNIFKGSYMKYVIFLDEKMHDSILYRLIMLQMVLILIIFHLKSPIMYIYIYFLIFSCFIAIS